MKNWNLNKLLTDLIAEYLRNFYLMAILLHYLSETNLSVENEE